MFKPIRASKYRHIYGECKLPKYNLGITIGTYAHDSQLCAVNTKFVAIVTEVDGGGAFVVIPITQTGKIDILGKVSGHLSPVLDIKWNPFNENQIASCSEDCTIKLWNIPNNGLVSDLTDCVKKLNKHRKKVTQIEWHPTAENVIFSAGFDNLLIVWDFDKETPINIIDCHTDYIHSIALNRDGSLLATTSKDKKLRIIEPRTGDVKHEGICHENKKSSKVTFLGDNGQLLTTGFTRNSGRQYSIWDPNDLTAPLTTDTIDSSAGILFPFYDYDTGILYLAGKGDGNIGYYEIVRETPYIHHLSIFQTGNPQRGLGVMPKRGLKTANCEIFRFYKLNTAKNLCEPVSMIVPRNKSEHFHEDLYPNTAGPTPALSAEEWIRGRNAGPVLISLDSDNMNIDTTHAETVKEEINTKTNFEKKEKPQEMKPEVRSEVKHEMVTPKRTPEVKHEVKTDVQHKKEPNSKQEVEPKQNKANRDNIHEKLNNILQGTPEVRSEVMHEMVTPKRTPEVKYEVKTDVQPKEEPNNKQEVEPTQNKANRDNIHEKLNNIIQGTLTECTDEDQIEIEPLNENLIVVVERIREIKEEVESITPKILSIDIDTSSLEYYSCLESLLVELDNLKTEGHKEIRRRRKEVMSLIRGLTDHLDSL